MTTQTTDEVQEYREIAPNVYADDVHAQQRAAWMRTPSIKGYEWREGVIEVVFDGTPADWSRTIGALDMLYLIVEGRADEQPPRGWWMQFEDEMPGWWRAALFAPDLIGSDKIAGEQGCAVIRVLRRLVSDAIHVVLTCQLPDEDEDAG